MPDLVIEAMKTRDRLLAMKRGDRARLMTRDTRESVVATVTKMDGSAVHFEFLSPKGTIVYTTIYASGLDNHDGTLMFMDTLPMEEPASLPDPADAPVQDEPIGRSIRDVPLVSQKWLDLAASFEQDAEMLRAEKGGNVYDSAGYTTASLLKAAASHLRSAAGQYLALQQAHERSLTAPSTVRPEEIF